MKLISRTEELIFLTILKLKDRAYCVPILEHKGYLISEMGEPSSERGGKSKRFYKVTNKGLVALQEIRKLQQSSWEGVVELVMK